MMKNKNTLVLGGVFLLLVIVYFATSFRPREVSRGAVSLFAGAVPDIDKIEVNVPRHDDITIEKEGEVWNITKPLRYKASPEVIQEVFSRLGETMIDGVVSSNPAERERFGVSDSSAAHLRMYDGGKVVLDMFIGKHTPDVSHIYARMAGSDDIVMLRGLSGRIAIRELDGWRDRTIYSVNEGDVTSVTVTAGGIVRRLTLADSLWTYTENGKSRPVDQAKTWQAVKIIASLTGEAFAMAEDIPRAGSNPPDARVTFTVRNGDTNAFELWSPRPDDASGVYLVRSAKGDQLYRFSRQHGDILVLDYRYIGVSG